MADAAVGFLLENLKQLLLYNAELIGDAKDQIEGLHKDLILFKAFLRDSTEKRNNNNVLQALVDNIRSVVDKTEDIVDKFVVEKSKYKAKNAFGRAIGAIDHSLTIRNIAKDIESIRKDVKQIYDQKQFGFQDLRLEDVPDRSANERKQQPPVVEEENVVGFDEEAKKVIDFLMGKDEDLGILTIIGMPGLGKTTLAKKVYNDQDIEYVFFSRVWVYVSQRYSRRQVLLSLLSNLTLSTDHTNKTDEAIATEVRKHLEKGKYLIVMDDVWTREAWNDFKNVFPNSKSGSRILITSRHNEVALHANPNKPPHMLNFLSPEHSWELLEIKVFGKQKCPLEELRRLGEQIAIKCEGLPLAVVVVAGMLLNNRDSSDWWKQVAGNEKLFITKDDVGQFMDVIGWSYNHLPYHLRSCFLYLGVFPKHYEIPVWKLIRLWIAEGFIEESEELSLEDIAEAYVRDLVNRSLLIAIGRRSNGEIRTCRIHDMLYDFCKREAENQNLYRDIKNFGEVTLDRYRRICIHSDVLEYIKSRPNGEHVRSFVCFPPKEIALPREHMSTISNAFKLLRVLDIKSIIFEIFPKDIIRLALLRYLALSCNVKALPASISNLWNIQTLIFMTSSNVLQVKEDFWKMYQLRHLCTNASSQLPRPSATTKGRENVQSLSMISPDCCTNDVFARTANIKKLGVRGNLVVLFGNLFDNVGKLRHLTNLKLINDIISGSLSDGKIMDLPPPYKFPKNLKKLTLSETLLEWEQMEILGKLEKLEILKLKDNAFTGTVWTPKDGGFLSLKLLHIGRTKLVTWNASKHHFPSLKRLVLQHCEELRAVPIGLADVASFQILELFRTTKAAASAKEIQQKKAGVFKLSVYPPPGV